MQQKASHLPSFTLTGKTVLVTGAARGIGRALALACAEAGADMALGLRDKSTGASLVGEIAAMGRKVLPLQLDVTKLDQIDRAVAEIERSFGRIDVLVNNVGVGPENPAEKVTEADFDFTVHANLKGTFFVSQKVAHGMIARKSGRIVNMSSQAGSVTLYGESIYCMTKAGDQSPDPLPGRRMGAARHHGEQRGADLHLYRRHGAGAGGPRIQAQDAGAYSAGTHRGDPGRRGRGGVPGLGCRQSHHRHKHAGGWRLVGGVRAAYSIVRAGHDEGEHEAVRGNPVAPQKSLHSLSES